MTYHPPQCSEREPDGRWEDCLWCSIVMLGNAAYRSAHYPSTQHEYEALRRASGDSMIGGSNMDNAVKGMDARWGWHGKVTSDALFALRALQPGETCALNGNMAAVSDHLRRWDPEFRGAHCVAVTKDADGRLFWQNPQAPQTYPGEYVAMVEAERYAGWQIGARAMTVRIGQRATVATPHIVNSAPTPAERNVMINEAGLTVVSSHVKTLAQGQPLFRYPGGPRMTSMSKTGPVEYFGSAGKGWSAVRVLTGAAYADGVQRPTVLYVPSAAGPVTAK